MSITTKISVFFALICLFLTICVFSILKQSENSTKEFENQQIKKSIEIFFEALKAKSSFLQNIAYEHSINDNVLKIVEEKENKTNKTNFIKDKYTHFFLFDKNKNFIYGNVYDINSDEFVSIPNAIKTFFKTKEIDIYLDKNRVNFITLDYEKILFTIEKVFKNNKFVGYVFVGRSLDSLFLSELSKITHQYLSFLPSHTLIKKKYLKLDSNLIYYDISRVDEYSLFSYLELTDQLDNSNFYIRMKMNRDYFIRINKNNKTIFYIFIITFIILIIAIYFFIDKLFAKRIKNISNVIKNISKSSSLDLKIELDYNDEITYLSKKINEMLYSINLKQHENLKKQRDFLQSVLDTQKNIILITDGKDIHTTNKKFVDIFKSKDEFLTNIALLDNKTQDNLVKIAKKYDSYEKPAKLKIEDELKYFTFDVQKLDMQKYLICMDDVSKYNEKICHLEQKASMDELTQVYNKSTITTMLNCWLEIRSFCLIIFDIDYFKNINDTYGHFVGDCVLKDLASLIRNILPKNDILGRFGGEEFIVLINDNSSNNIISIANRLKKEVENKRFIYDDALVNLTISLGTTFCIKGESYQDVYKRADEALYEAKNRGRNRVCFK
jgi:diguanylate cyclase (GGDEF)-like protein